MSSAGIIDIHQHYGALIGVPGSSGDAGAGLERDRDSRLEGMEHFGVAKTALMPGHSYSAPRGLTDIRAINDGLHEYGKLEPERFAALFGTVDPRHGKASIGEVERVADLGFAGLSWHHRMQGLPMDHPVMFEIVARMDALGLIALVHCYANGDFEAPWRLRRLAERFPGTTFVALDAMTSPGNCEQLIAIAEANPNVFIDLTSTLLGGRGVLMALERLGAGRLVYGSNSYSMTQPSSIAALDAVDEAGLGEADRQAILGGNAARILGMTEGKETS
ncbi:MAG: amidohydrolase family protein [Novosphingobium sp.]|nr:amidohydrolase family protein [Novosphingobium sp.]